MTHPLLIDYDTAVTAAELCSINIDLVINGTERKAQTCALLTARAHCELVEQYAEQVLTYGQPRGKETPFECAGELRAMLRQVQKWLDSELIS